MYETLLGWISALVLRLGMSTEFMEQLRRETSAEDINFKKVSKNSGYMKEISMIM
jgi:hypothetical protein